MSTTVVYASTPLAPSLDVEERLEKDANNIVSLKNSDSTFEETIKFFKNAKKTSKPKGKF